MRAVLLLAILVLPAASQTLASRIQALIRSTPGAAQAFWGIKAVDPARGRTLVSINADHLFRPASNTKLFTSALALSRLGPDYALVTLVTSVARPDEQGRLAGDLVLVGGGDPSLSGRVIPYKYGAVAGDPLAPLDELAGQVAAQGVRIIDGDIVGDDTAYEWEPYPEGWTLDDSLWLYGAPVSALAVGDSAIKLTLKPGPAPGLPPSLTLTPALEYFAIDNRVRWGPGLERKILVERTGGRIRLTGTMPPATVDLLLAVDEPALYAAYAFRDALIRRGIVVRGRPVARHRRQGEPAPPLLPVELGRRSSPPLIELLRVINKVSQNLHTEMILREAVRRGHLRESFLAQVGIPAADFALEDGSGLARQNLVTPNAVMSLLLYMYNSPHRESWVSLMPIGGADGTLDDRFDGNPGARRVHAKTGTLGGASALSGYIDRRRGGRIAFSILVNNYTAETKVIRGLMDRIALLLATAV